MRSLFQKQWFLICLAIILFVGFSFSSPLSFLAHAGNVRSLLIATILFLTALVLETSAIWTAVRRPWPTVLAVTLNYGLLPLVAWATVDGFLADKLDGQLGRQLSLGVIAAAVAPCTLASAAVWTRRAGGNDAVAIMVTVITNLACFVMTPLWLGIITGQSDVPIVVRPMIWKLAMLVVFPMMMGQAFRQYSAVAVWASAQKQRLTIVSQLGILFILLTGAVSCGLELQATGMAGLPWKDFILMTIAVAMIHVSVLGFGQVMGRLMGFSRGDWIAVGFAGSQKTLPVGLQVASMLGGGLTILPIVTYHVLQLFVDTVVADRLAAREVDEGCEPLALTTGREKRKSR